MSKSYKNITSFLLLTLGLVILSHAIIPHEHHYDVTVETSEHEHQEKDKSGHEPIHCHYLNVIDFDKDIAYNFTKVINELPVVYIIFLYNLFDFDLNYQVSNFINLNTNLPDYYLLISISPTRGSPLV